MRIRHETNTNLTLHYGPAWNGLPVQYWHGPLAVNYLESIYSVIRLAVDEYSRTCAIRFDVRLPQDCSVADTAVISRLIASLKSQIREDIERKLRAGKRVHHTRVRYIWVKERDGADNFHYHVVIFLNRDSYFKLGRFKSNSTSLWDDVFSESDDQARVNMSNRIHRALASALHRPVEEVIGLVHFPQNAVYKIDFNSLQFNQQFSEVFKRISYFAKANTKFYGDSARNFGCSHG